MLDCLLRLTFWQDLIPGSGPPKTDASGNPMLKDVGAFLKAEFKRHFDRAAGQEPADVKYIDPTYMVRAIPSTGRDHIYCKILAFNAVDAAFAGMYLQLYIFSGSVPLRNVCN